MTSIIFIVPNETANAPYGGSIFFFCKFGAKFESNVNPSKLFEIDF